MDPFNAIAGGSVILALFASALTFFLPLAVLAIFAIVMIKRSKQVDVVRAEAAAWPTVTGTVLISTTQVRRIGKSRSLIPVVVYQYEVAGIAYQGKIIRAGDQYGTVRFSGDAEATIARYPAGSLVSVRYNPVDPADAVLEV